MSRVVLDVAIQRIVIAGGVGAEGVEAGALRAAIVEEISRRLGTAPLPHARAVRTAVRIQAPPLSLRGPGGARAAAAAVASALGTVVGGRGGRG